MDTKWIPLFEVVLPCVMLAELLLLMWLQIFAQEDLIPGCPFMSPETIATLQIELRAKQAELDALKEESWPLKS